MRYVAPLSSLHTGLVFNVPPYKDRVLLDELFESDVTEEIVARDSVDIESTIETESEMKVTCCDLHYLSLVTLININICNSA